MTMRFSKDPDYRAYGRRVAEGDYAGADQALDACIERTHQIGTAGQLSLLLRFKARLHVRLGRMDAARRLAVQSVEVDPQSALAVYFAAKLLMDELADR